MNDKTPPLALITGGSSGLGLAMARRLRAQGHALLLIARDPVKLARVRDELKADGGAAAVDTLACDLAEEADVERAFVEIRARHAHIDLLVLNASGGLEKGVATDYAMQVNLTAQTRALDLALPLMGEGSRVVFVTSHLAHFHGQKPVYPAYEPVAASKRAGETALRERIPELDAKGISLVVVSGDLIEGSITPRLMERQAPGLIDARRDEAGGLPTVEEFAEAIADAAVDDGLATGETVYVGSTEWS